MYRHRHIGNYRNQREALQGDSRILWFGPNLEQGLQVLTTLSCCFMLQYHGISLNEKPYLLPFGIEDPLSDES